MKGSLQRVRAVMAGARPDRQPVFDLLPNDAVLRHFNNGVPVEPGDDGSGIRAIAAATDATRWSYFSPMREKTEILPDGRERKSERWTAWTAPRLFADSDEYKAVKKRDLARAWEQAKAPFDTAKDQWYQKHIETRAMFGEDYYFLLYGPSPGLGAAYEEVGLESFCYYLSDCEEIVVDQLELNTINACRWAEGLPAGAPFDMVFIGEDIAYKTGPMLSPDWLKRHYFPRLSRVIAAMHKRGKLVMFHSDGNLNVILDMLVEAGIDALNPIEIAAGMDLADLHRRYPRLVFAGGIDVSNLLPFGTPQQVKDAVVKAIEDTDGRILVGSSTEVLNMVPLENYLALRDAAMSYRG